MPEDKMVKPQDLSSDNENADNLARKHNRSSSSDQTTQLASSMILRSIEPNITPTSPSRPKSSMSSRPETKRRKSSTSSKHKTRPTYRRKYSTPPSRPISPSGFPMMLDPDMVIPELDLAQTSTRLGHAYNASLQVDTAPQEPDLWSDPETDYFSTIEGPASKHSRGKSRRQLSQQVNGTASLNALLAPNSRGLQKISEDKEGESLRIPGAFAI